MGAGSGLGRDSGSVTHGANGGEDRVDRRLGVRDLLTAANFTSANLTGAIGVNTTGAFLCNTTMPDGSISNAGCPYTPPGG